MTRPTIVRHHTNCEVEVCPGVQRTSFRRRHLGGIDTWALRSDPSEPCSQIESETLAGMILQPLRVSTARVQSFQSAVAA